MIARLLFAAVLLPVPAAVAAQDNNYNTHEFGSRSSLFGGAVVGGVRDTSAAYYNPGGLAFVEDVNLSVSASVYRFSRVDVHDGAGTGHDLRAFPFEQFPGIFSGIVRFDSLPDHTFGYSLLTRHRFALSADARVDEPRNVINDAYEPGTEDFIGQLDFDTSLDELWGGLSWAMRIHEEWGLGATTFVVLRQQDLSFNGTARAVGNPSGGLHSADFHVDSNYMNIRLLWRLGACWGTGDTRFGFAATTPSIDVWGTGTVFGDITVNQLDFDGDNVPNTFTANDRQSGLEARFRSPGSLSFGLEQRVSDWTFAATGDWYGRQGRFKIMQPEPSVFLRPSGSSPLDAVTEVLKVTYATRPVFNASVAAECAFSPGLRGILSFRTDFSAEDPKDPGDSGIQPGSSSWDLFHVTAGVLWRKEDKEKRPLEEVGIGLVYSFGRDRTKQVTNYSTAAESNLLFGTPTKTGVTYDAAGLLLGYKKYF